MSTVPRIDIEAIKTATDPVGLIGRFVALRKQGQEWVGNCPFHDDSTPSFHVTEHGFICFGCKMRGDVIRFIQEFEHLNAMDAARRVVSLNNLAPAAMPTQNGHVSQPKPFNIVKTYDYTDEQGNLLYQVCRLDPKSFRPRRPAKVGGWIWGLKDGNDFAVRLVLYNLPAITKSDTVCLCAGEKDADSLTALGLVATTNQGGEGKWRPEYTEQLAGKHVCLFPDNDAAGKKHAELVAGEISATVASFHVVRVQQGKDVADWIAAGATAETIRAAMQSARTAEDPTPFDSPADNADEQVAAVIAGRDASKAYALASVFAKLDSAKSAELKTKLRQEFGKEFRIRDFEKAIKDEIRKIRQSTPSGGGIKPRIRINNREPEEMIQDTLAALRLSNDPPRLFVRSGEMVFISTDEQQRPTIVPVRFDNLNEQLTRTASFVKVGAETDLVDWCPPKIVEAILALSPDVWELPALLAVVEVPTLRSDGTVLDVPGYDPQSQMFYAPASRLVIPEVPEHPETDDIEAALTLLDEAVGEFPYAEQASRANLMGLLITPIIRPALNSSTPLALIDAPQAGTGKSLLADVFSTIVTGRPAAMTPYPRNEEEMEKRLGAALRAGRSLVCFDNLEGSLRSPTLALVLTAKEYETRILGLSENMTVLNQATWLITGNNIQPTGDMPRRCYHIRLDAQLSKPFQGRRFRHPNLLQWVRDNRPRLLHALLIIARAWYAMGCPQAVTDPLGSFEEWHRTIGGVLKNAGIDGFLSNLDLFLDQADPAAIQWEIFLLAVAEIYPNGQSFTLKELTGHMRVGTELDQIMPDSIEQSVNRKKQSLERAVGYAFRDRKDKRFGKQNVFVRSSMDGGDLHAKVARWQVIVSVPDGEPRVGDQMALVNIGSEVAG